jgi:hypothetical protein
MKRYIIGLIGLHFISCNELNSTKIADSVETEIKKSDTFKIADSVETEVKKSDTLNGKVNKRILVRDSCDSEFDALFLNNSTNEFLNESNEMDLFNRIIRDSCFMKRAVFYFGESKKNREDIIGLICNEIYINSGQKKLDPEVLFDSLFISMLHNTELLEMKAEILKCVRE